MDIILDAYRTGYGRRYVYYDSRCQCYEIRYRVYLVEGNFRTNNHMKCIKMQPWRTLQLHFNERMHTYVPK